MRFCARRQLERALEQGQSEIDEAGRFLTSSVNLAGDVGYVGDNRKLAGAAELSIGVVVCGIVALVGCVFVFVGVFGHNAHEQLVQRVLDAFTVEGGHYDASMPSVSAGEALCTKPCLRVRRPNRAGPRGSHGLCAPTPDQSPYLCPP